MFKSLDTEPSSNNLITSFKLMLKRLKLGSSHQLLADTGSIYAIFNRL